MRHFALNWAFLCFTDLERRKYSFSCPIPSMQCCANVQATYRKQQTPAVFYCNVSTILLLIVG